MNKCRNTSLIHYISSLEVFRPKHISLLNPRKLEPFRETRIIVGERRERKEEGGREVILYIVCKLIMRYDSTLFRTFICLSIFYQDCSFYQSPFFQNGTCFKYYGLCCENTSSFCNPLFQTALFKRRGRMGHGVGCRKCRANFNSTKRLPHSNSIHHVYEFSSVTFIGEHFSISTRRVTLYINRKDSNCLG